jgi:hypothetical protein
MRSRGKLSPVWQECSGPASVAIQERATQLNAERRDFKVSQAKVTR